MDDVLGKKHSGRVREGRNLVTAKNIRQERGRFGKTYYAHSGRLWSFCIEGHPIYRAFRRGTRSRQESRKKKGSNCIISIKEDKKQPPDPFLFRYTSFNVGKKGEANATKAQWHRWMEKEGLLSIGEISK